MIEYTVIFLQISPKELDSRYAYIQVTYVQPYFDEQEMEKRKNYFQKNHNIKHFVFETPFTTSGRARGSIEEQWKRKTILTSKYHLLLYFYSGGIYSSCTLI